MRLFKMGGFKSGKRPYKIINVFKTIVVCYIYFYYCIIMVPVNNNTKLCPNEDTNFSSKDARKHLFYEMTIPREKQ